MTTNRPIFVRAIIVSICLLGREATHGDDNAASKGKPDAAKVEPKPADSSPSPSPAKPDDVKQEPKSAKYAEGYESGVVAGESAHNAGETNRSHPPLEHQNPFVTGAVIGKEGGVYPETNHSLLTVSNPDVLLWALKPHDDGIASASLLAGGISPMLPQGPTLFSPPVSPPRTAPRISRRTLRPSR